MPFVASRERILVQNQEKSLLVFDKDGYIIHDNLPIDYKDQEVVQYSS